MKENRFKLNKLHYMFIKKIDNDYVFAVDNSGFFENCSCIIWSEKYFNTMIDSGKLSFY